MRLQINKDFLRDSPYEPGFDDIESVFQFDESQVNDLVSEILYAQPTCYLVSGYRGSGKTSFINRVKEKCEEQYELPDPDVPVKSVTKVMFIYSGFSRYENQTFFLRKIVRDLYEAVCKYDRKNGSVNQQKASELYNATFRDVKRQRSQIEEEERKSETVIDWMRMFKAAAKVMLPFFFPLLIEVFIRVFPANHLEAAIRWIVYGGLSVWGAFSFIERKQTFTTKQGRSESLVENTIADTDITTYYLEELLEKLKSENIKPVFVLDELDKVDDDDMDKLFKEMKPWLVRGKADFIVVAGQRLTMKYYQSKEKDDEILASIFSKIMHIRIQNSENFTRLFMGFLLEGVIVNQNNQNVFVETQNLPAAEENAASELCTSFIYRSRMLPRTYMNLVRQEIHWENERAYIEFTTGSRANDVAKFNLLRKCFADIRLNADIPETIKDHVIMQLFQVASRLQPKNKLSLEDCLLPYKLQLKDVKSESEYSFANPYPYPELYAFLEKYITDLYNDAAKTFFASEFGRFESSERKRFPKNFKHADDFEKFVNEFVSFFSLLRVFLPMLTDLKEPDIPVNDMKLSDVLRILDERNIVKISVPKTGILDENYQFFEFRRKEMDVYDDVKTAFKKHKIIPADIVNALFKQLLFKLIREQLAGDNQRLELADDLKDAEKERFICKLVSVDQESAPDTLFRYIFTSSNVRVEPSEIHSNLQTLKDYNSKRGKGNYYIQVIVSHSQTGFDREKEMATTRELINKLDHSLAGKLIYVILFSGSPHELVNGIHKVKNAIEPYQPQLSKRK